MEARRLATWSLVSVENEENCDTLVHSNWRREDGASETCSAHASLVNELREEEEEEEEEDREGEEEEEEERETGK